MSIEYKQAELIAVQIMQGRIYALLPVEKMDIFYRYQAVCYAALFLGDMICWMLYMYTNRRNWKRQLSKKHCKA